MSSRRKILVWACVVAALVGGSWLLWRAFRAPLPELMAVDSNSTFVPCIEYREGEEHRYRAGCRGRMTAGEYAADVSFNRLGLRDEEPEPPSPGEKRVLVVGGSMVMGAGVAEKETFPRRLEKKLRRSLGPKVRVINAGTVGYCESQNALRLREYLEIYRPQVVVNFLQRKCFWTDLVILPGTEWGEGGEPRRFHKNPLLLWGWPLWARSFVYSRPMLQSLLFSVVDISARYRAMRSLGTPGPNPSAEQLQRFMAGTLTYMDFMRKESRRHGAEFVLVWGEGGTRRKRNFAAQMIPSTYNQFLYQTASRFLFNEWPFYGQLAEGIMTEQGYPLVTVTEVFVDENKHYMIPGDFHPNEQGHEVIAERLASFLLPKFSGR